MADKWWMDESDLGDFTIEAERGTIAFVPERRDAARIVEAQQALKEAQTFKHQIALEAYASTEASWEEILTSLRNRLHDLSEHCCRKDS